MTPKVNTTVGSADWVNVAGAAALVAGATWQNLGPDHLLIAFTTAKPAGGATDAYHRLALGEAIYDKNGSANVWAKSIGSSQLCATAD